VTDATFVHAVVRAPRPVAPAVMGAVSELAPWLALAGRSGIGWASDEVPVILAGDPESALAARVAAAGGEVERVIRLVATVRPTDIEPPELVGGVVALRTFEVAESDAAEFVELSAAAWPTFEELYAARVLGLFRQSDPAAHLTFLLATWYDSLSEWERSREAVGAQSGPASDAGRRFRRRREITLRTQVRIGVPL